MHPQAYEWVAKYATNEVVSVLDIGGRDINGSCKPLFPNADPYTVLDIADGDNVEIVADAAMWMPNREYDIVVCTEVFEHTASWPEICATAYKALRPGGKFIVTCAGPGRPAHSAIDGGWKLHDGEFYANVESDALSLVLIRLGFSALVDQQPDPADVRAFAEKVS